LNFGAEYKTLVTRVDKWLKDNDPTQDSKVRRGLWRELQELKHAAVAREEITEEQFKQLEDKLSQRKKKTPYTVVSFINFLGCVFAFLLGWPFLMLISLCRPIHFVMRYFGFRNGKLPLDITQRWFAKYLLLVLGVHIEVRGLANLKDSLRGSPTLGLFQHASNLDGIIICSISPVTFKWIGKRSIYCVPFFGALAYAFNSIIGIDRSNKEKAIKSLDRAQVKMTRDRRSIAISPEGTRSKSGQLQEFKKGAFHMATKVKVPLSPILLYGAYDIWPPGQTFPVSGHVTVQFCPQMMPSEFEKLDYNELLVKTHKLMLRSLEDNYPPHFSSSAIPTWFAMYHYLALIFTYSGFYFFYSWVWGVVLAFFA